MELFRDYKFLKMKNEHKNKQSKCAYFGTLMDCRQLVYGDIQSQCCHRSFSMSADSAYWYPLIKINGIPCIFLLHYIIPILALCASFRYY